MPPSAAVSAAQVAAGEPDEDARQPGPGAFALDAQEDFTYDKRVGHGSNLAGDSQNGKGEWAPSARDCRKAVPAIPLEDFP